MLKLVLNKCIYDSQSSFAPKRYILDNTMSFIEIVHYMKLKVKAGEWMLLQNLTLAKLMIGLIGIILEVL